MSTNAIKRRICNGWINAVCAVTALVALIAARSEALGQQEVARVLPPSVNLGPPSSCPHPVTLPSVPLQAPRPGEGAAVEQRWQRGLDPAAPPVSSLVQSLKGNDAVIEVIVGQSRLLTLKAFQTVQDGDELRITDIVVADDRVVECDWVKNRAVMQKQGNDEVPVVKDNQRLLRVKGLRPGVTQLSITTPDDQTYALEVHVLYDLDLFGLQLKQAFPNASLRLFQIREHLAVEGEARSIRQVEQILQTIEAYLSSMQKELDEGGTGAGSGDGGRGSTPEDQRPGQTGADGRIKDQPQGQAASGGASMKMEMSSGSNQSEAKSTPPIINLLRVPGVHQVMLQVRIAELNRTGLRQIGADFLWNGDNVLGTLLGGGTLTTAGDTGINLSTTLFGVFDTGQFEFVLRALRTNSVLSVLAEPNLVALSGQKADFLAGGEFPVPVPQNSGGGTTITVEFKKFGVQLEFTPYVLEDESIRLVVNSEESSPDYSRPIEIEGYFVPGINTRRASTTVEMRQGQSLAVAGLLRTSIDANTKRIPGVGDLPYIGPFFSNTTHTRQEKELLILVTPYLVAPMNAENVPCLPGEELKDPNDWEFYLLNRIEGRTGRDWSAAREWDDPWHLRQLMHLERSSISGPVGFSSCE